MGVASSGWGSQLSLLVEVSSFWGVVETSEWDSAAAQAIVEEAGGMVIDTKHKRLEYNTKESLLNPEFLVIADKEFDWQQYI